MGYEMDGELAYVTRGEARSFVRAAQDAISHAISHIPPTGAVDAMALIISIDHAVELLLKGCLLQKGESIFEGSKTLGLHAALGRFPDMPGRAGVEVLREKRNSLQHAAYRCDELTAADLFEGAMRFIDELVAAEFDISLDVFLQPTGYRPAPARVQIPSDLVASSRETQRDAGFGGGVLVWAEGWRGTLRLRLRTADGVIRWLAPEDNFEYMPQTDGHLVAAYRQSGGISVYDLEDESRWLLSETGGPTAVEGEVVVAQGVGVPGGLAGGIWLIERSGAVEQLAESGDSGRISDGAVVWQDFRDGSSRIILRDDAGSMRELGEGSHPAIYGRQVVFTRDGVVTLVDTETGVQKFLGEGLFPDIRGDLVVFLRRRNDTSHSLHLYRLIDESEVWSLKGVAFPTGRGPILTDRSVVWEERLDNRVGALREAPI